MSSKVVYIGHSANMEGAERSFLESIKALKMMGVEVIAFLPSQGPLCKKLHDIKTPYYFLDFPRWMRKNKISLLKKIEFILMFKVEELHFQNIRYHARQSRDTSRPVISLLSLLSTLYSFTSTTFVDEFLKKTNRRSVAT